MPTVEPKAVETSKVAEDMLRFDLYNEVETIANYRARIYQAEALGEFALAEILRDILIEEQDHAIDLATALGNRSPTHSEHRSRRDHGGVANRLNLPHSRG